MTTENRAYWDSHDGILRRLFRLELRSLEWSTTPQGLPDIKCLRRLLALHAQQILVDVFVGTTLFIHCLRYAQCVGGQYCGNKPSK